MLVPMYALPAIIDVEASALDMGYPIEIGLAKCDLKTGKISQQSMVIRHDPWLENGHWSPEAEAIHGITKEEIYDTGRPVEEVCTWLNDALGPHATAHVGDFKDKIWLSQAFDAANRVHLFQLDYIGSFMQAAAISQQRYLDYLGDLHHRAGEDAVQMTRALYRAMTLSFDTIA